MSIVVFNYKCNKCGNKFPYTHNSDNETEDLKCPECSCEDVKKIFNILDGQDGPTIGGYYIQHDYKMNQYVEMSKKHSQNRINEFKKKKK